jgi:hypothetical protein
MLTKTQQGFPSPQIVELRLAKLKHKVHRKMIDIFFYLVFAVFVFQSKQF